VVDWAIHKLLVGLSDEIWSDSAITLTSRAGRSPQQKTRIISMRTERIKPASGTGPQPSFVFWGRLAPQKGLDRALRIFARLVKEVPRARFQVIGPDLGSYARLKALCSKLNITGAVEFVGPLSHEEVLRRGAQHSFYLQTSVFEGMAMSVVEAMQLGLVPIITPVGEIARYCVDGVNSIVISDDESAVEEVLRVLGNARKFQELRENAIATWDRIPLYKDSVMEACSALAGAAPGAN
jgi:glycosyltransferase involved in cell wall biosynthesis